MSTRVIIPKEYLYPTLMSRFDQIRRFGIDPKHLIQYSLMVDRSGRYDDIAGYVNHDIVEVFPDFRDNVAEYKTLLHQCMDCILEMSEIILSVVRMLSNSEYLTHRHLSFDRFMNGDVSIIVNH